MAAAPIRRSLPPSHTLSIPPGHAHASAPLTSHVSVLAGIRHATLSELVMSLSNGSVLSVPPSLPSHLALPHFFPLGRLVK